MVMIEKVALASGGITCFWILDSLLWIPNSRGLIVDSRTLTMGKVGLASKNH